ncbi:MAG: zinc ribbon domain-containing protein [Oscillochloridaceae bacterium umkhey_bin13]
MTQPAKFCPQCGAPLPPGGARFCIECGYALPARMQPPEPVAATPTPLAPVPAPAPAARKASPPTVQLPNARVAQQVIGGTVKLPTTGAVPPGLWIGDEPPGPSDVVAIYPPLRPIRDGWSGLIGRGWQADGSEQRAERTIFMFRAEVPWFPADGCGRGLRLITQVVASSYAFEGKERRGFRFGVLRNGPMRIVRAVWYDGNHAVPDQPLPEIQLMAPPRVPRVSDLDEAPRLLDARTAANWAEGSLATGAYRLHRDQLVQEHTPVGRGITLVPLREAQAGGRPWWGRLLPGVMPTRYRAQVTRLFTCELKDWKKQLKAIRREAASLGLDLEPALAAEWWLDRQGYDGVRFTGARAKYEAEQVLIVFRRAQLAQIED